MGMGAVAQVLVAVATLLVARACDPAEFAVTMTAIVLGLVTASVADFGATAHVVREWSSGSIFRADASSRLLGKVVIFWAAALLGLGLCLALDAPRAYWFAPAIALSTALTQATRAPLQAAGRNDRAALVGLLERCVLLGVSVLGLTLHPHDPQSLLVAWTVAALASAGIAWFIAPSGWRISIRQGVSNPWREARGYGWFGAAVAAQGFDLPLLTLLVGAHLSGSYAAVQKWVAPLSLLTSAASSTAVPYIARATSRRSALRVMLPLWPMFAAATGLCFTVAVLAHPLAELALGTAYAGAGALLQVLALSAGVAVFTQPLAVTLMTMGHDSYVANITVAVVLGQGLLLAATASSLGSMAAPMALLVAQLALLAGYLWGLRYRASAPRP